MYSLRLFVLAIAGSSLAAAYIQPHSKSSSQYIHGNDTIQLTLSDDQSNVLYGPAGSMHSLEFSLLNEGRSGHFDIRQASDDGFVGVLDTSRVHLNNHQEQKIRINNLRVPTGRPEGSTVRLTLTVRRDTQDYRRKRAAEQAPGNGGNIGGGNIGGGSGQYPGGNNNNNNNYPGNNYPGNNNNNYPGNNNNNNYPGDNYPGNNDPSYRDELSVTVIFTVASEVKDNSNPYVKLTYGAKEDDQTCQYGPDDANCGAYYWWVQFTIQDEESGLNTIRFLSDGKDTSGEPIYYRYENFPIGSKKEQNMVAAASCCVEGIKLLLTDVKGNQVERVASNEGTGTPMSKGLKWGLIGGGVALVIILILIFSFCCYRKKYSAVASDP